MPQSASRRSRSNQPLGFEGPLQLNRELVDEGRLALRGGRQKLRCMVPMRISTVALWQSKYQRASIGKRLQLATVLRDNRLR
jgi:hypothetical protein